MLVVTMSAATAAAFRLTTFSMVMLVVTMPAAATAAFRLTTFSMVMLVVTMPAAATAAFRIFNESDTDVTGDFVIGWISTGLDDFSIDNSDRQNCISFRFDFFIDHFVGFELLRIIRQIEKQSFIVLQIRQGLHYCCNAQGILAAEQAAACFRFKYSDACHDSFPL
jgi:hypothetical protein